MADPQVEIRRSALDRLLNGLPSHLLYYGSLLGAIYLTTGAGAHLPAYFTALITGVGYSLFANRIQQIVDGQPVSAPQMTELAAALEEMQGNLDHHLTEKAFYNALRQLTQRQDLLGETLCQRILVGLDKLATREQADTLIAGQQEILQRLPSLTEFKAPTLASAVLAEVVDDLPERSPSHFVGRAKLAKDVTTLLESGKQVLLHGFPGMGKTALAAFLAEGWLKAGKGHCLWISAGQAGAEALLEAVARRFGLEREIAPLPLIEKISDLRKCLRDSSVKLLVADDCWDGQALFTLLKIAPQGLPVLITARQTYPLGKPAETRSVEQLPPPDARDLLNYHARQTFETETGQADTLCQRVGYHPYALEIAGKTLQRQSLTDLMKKLAARAHDLNMPLDLADQGRKTIALLIEASLSVLDADVKATFLVFGAFFAPRLTAEMAGLYLNKPEITPEQLASYRPEKQIAAYIPDEIVCGVMLNEGISAGRPAIQVAAALSTLELHSLISRVTGDTSQRDIESIPYYRTHDLAYSYARAQNDPGDRTRALDACLSYTKRYYEPSLPNFAALLPELDNLLGAAAYAMEIGNYADVEDFADKLYFGTGTGGALNRLGLNSAAITLLGQAAEAAGRAGRRANQGAHLGNLGNAYYSLGQVERAIGYHEQALTISREIGNKSAEGSILGNLGTTYFSLGQVERAIGYHEQALSISREIGDKRNEGNQLGNLGNAYAALGQVERAIDYYEQALTISREIGDKRGEGTALGNLGLAYAALGQVERAIAYHEQALSISRAIGDKRAEGQDLGNLGNAYAALGQVARAIEHYEQALGISREIGDKRGEGNRLGNLGNAYADLGQVERAIGYHEQALGISRAIGDKGNEGNQLGNLGNAYAALGQVERAIALYEQARAIFVEIKSPLVEWADARIAEARARLGGG